MIYNMGCGLPPPRAWVVSLELFLATSASLLGQSSSGAGPFPLSSPLTHFTLLFPPRLTFVAGVPTR